jgi:uncharacterized protein
MKPGLDDATILWRRLDVPGHEAARLTRRHTEWQLAGMAVFEYDTQRCGLHYEIVCDSQWKTASARVRGWVGPQTIAVDVLVNAGKWRLNGRECPAVDGCTDIDLNFSPSTNLLPIRRLDLAVGDEAQVRAAWLRFPGFTLEPLEQLYRRVDETTYRYESAGGRFAVDLRVTAAGFAVHYPGFWQAENGR